jgi:hypothetical protein
MFRIEYDGDGRFRITASGGRIKGEWTSYTSIATLDYFGTTYIAGSEYGLLPCANAVYELSGADTIVVPAPEKPQARCGECNRAIGSLWCPLHPFVNQEVK